LVAILNPAVPHPGSNPLGLTRIQQPAVLTAAMLLCARMTCVQVMNLWTKGGNLEVVVLPEAAAASTDLEKIAPKDVLKSPGFSRALFELFLGENSIVAAARPVWAAGAKDLVESEQVKRESRKGGSG
jgi:hypothetical protein